VRADRDRNAAILARIPAGHWGKPEETAKSINADGWLPNGDIGMLDDEGCRRRDCHTDYLAELTVS